MGAARRRGSRGRAPDRPRGGKSSTPPRPPFSEWVRGGLATWSPPGVWGQRSGTRGRGRGLFAPCAPAALWGPHSRDPTGPSPCSHGLCKFLPPASLTPGEFSPTSRPNSRAPRTGSRHACPLQPGPGVDPAAGTASPPWAEQRRGSSSAPGPSGPYSGPPAAVPSSVERA